VSDGTGPARGRLLRKYVALFAAVVCAVLLGNGLVEAWFLYREQTASLSRIQSEQAEAAAAKIGQFVAGIESQLGWTTQLPWSAETTEQRRFDARRLLRQVPAITELAMLDGTGHERLRVSRLALDVIDGQADLSADPKFTEAVPEFARLFPVVAKAEEAGDAIATEVLERAGCELAATAQGVIGRLFLDSEHASVATHGGVFTGSVLVKEAFRAELNRLCPRAICVDSEIDPALGALQRARREFGVWHKS